MLDVLLCVLRFCEWCQDNIEINLSGIYCDSVVSFEQFGPVGDFRLVVIST